jgi:hydrogenase expression/formation protein HypD
MVNNDIEKAKSIIKNYNGKPLKIMEVCGTHTHEIFKLGIRNLLPKNINLISGPGCPVCVTPTTFIDEAIYLALERDVTICTFGDLIRVPGTKTSLGGARSKGAKIQIVYSPLDSVEYAKSHIDEQVVFLSVGFETTTPASCIAVRNAKTEDLRNYSILTANKTMHQAYIDLKDACDAYIYPGHVCAMSGMHELYELRDKENISGAVTGFSASEILVSFAYLIDNLQENKPFVANLYPSVVTEDGLTRAKTLVDNTFEPCDSTWRGLGIIRNSGLKLKDEYIDYDAREKFSIPEMDTKQNTACRCGDVLKGDIKPFECPLFSKGCNPDHPVGACMVSSEGACTAYYKYGENLWKKN